jgi:WD40 repeat protein
VDALQPGDPRSVGRYHLLGRLGSGGMGQFFLGVSPGGRMVAVKLIHPALARTAQFRERFAREIEAARRVGGFHTAPVVDADPLADPPWMVTAYIEGPSLEEAVERDGPMAPDRIRAVGAGLAEGLAVIHAHGLVHRDLKPGNVIVAPDGPRIIDFGIARAVDGTGLTTAGSVIGTCAYMSPEQIRGETAGPPSDVFALGCVLAFAATGRPPFNGETAATIIYRILGQPPDLGGLPAGDLHELIAACLAKSPQDRPGVHAILATLGRSTGFVPAGPGLAQSAPAGPGLIPGGPPGGPKLTPGDPVTWTRPPLRAPGPTGPDHVPPAGQAPPGPAGFPVPPRGTGRRRMAALVIATAVLAALATALPILLTRSPTHAAAGQRSTAPATTAATGIATATVRSTPSPTATTLGTRTPATPVTSGPATQSAVTDGIPAGGLWVHDADGGPSDNVVFSPDGSHVAAGSVESGGSAYVWDIPTGTLAARLTGPGYGVAAVAFSPDGTLLADADADNSAYVWNWATRTLTASLPDPIGGTLLTAAFSPDGSLLATGEGNRHVVVWDVASHTMTLTLTVASPVNGVAFSPDGALLAGAGASGFLWDMPSGKRVGTFVDPGSKGTNAVAFSPDGKLLAVADSNGSAYVYNVASGALTATFTAPGPRSIVGGVAFSPDGTLLAAAEANGHAYLWDVATGQLAGSFTDPKTAQVSGAAFSPDGRLLAVCDENGNVFVRAVSQLTS